MGRLTLACTAFYVLVFSAWGGNVIYKMFFLMTILFIKNSYLKIGFRRKLRFNLRKNIFLMLVGLGDSWVDGGHVENHVDSQAHAIY